MGRRWRFQTWLGQLLLQRLWTAVLSGNRFPFAWEVNPVHYFTRTSLNKVMIQNQKKSEKRNINWGVYILSTSRKYQKDIIICIVLCFIV